MNRLALSRWVTLIGYFGLLIVLLNWFVWIAPPSRVPRSFLLIVLLVPLLVPLRGLLHARRYTHQWVSFLSLFYFMVGVDVYFNPGAGQSWLGALTIIFSLLLFVGCVFFARFR